MMVRCFNQNRKQWMDYGGRGIKPCEFIKATPANVISVIGERPSRELQIERMDNDSGYTCGQCPDCLKNGWKLNIRWANRMEQSQNKRTTVFIYKDGYKLTRRQWALKLGKDYWWVRNHIG
jgi:hypothetical protein